MNNGPLIVQSDKTLLLDIDHPDSVECRRAIAPFAELERSPEHIHTYRLTKLTTCFSLHTFKTFRRHVGGVGI